MIHYCYFVILWFRLALAQGQQKPLATETIQGYLSNLPQMSALVSLLNQNTLIQSYLEGCYFIERVYKKP
jgi:hypothetical protein